MFREMNRINEIGRKGKGKALAIDSSLVSDMEDNGVEEFVSPKTFLTLWSTISSTQTVTAYATNMQFTVSVSAYCSIVGDFVNGC